MYYIVLQNMENKKMYFCRFNKNILAEALHKKYITTEEYSLIEKFWYDCIFYDLNEEDLMYLESLGFKFEILKNNIKCTYYPHLKIMCLKVCKRDPKKWLYETELDGQFLFGYKISIEGCLLVKHENDFLMFKREN